MKCAHLDCWHLAEVDLAVTPDCHNWLSEDEEDHKDCLQEIEGQYCVKHASELLKQYSEYLLTKGKVHNERNHQQQTS